MGNVEIHIDVHWQKWYLSVLISGDKYREFFKILRFRCIDILSDFNDHLGKWIRVVDIYQNLILNK